MGWEACKDGNDDDHMCICLQSFSRFSYEAFGLRMGQEVVNSGNWAEAAQSHAKKGVAEVAASTNSKLFLN